jgi:hypothetical protein
MTRRHPGMTSGARSLKATGASARHPLGGGLKASEREPGSSQPPHAATVAGVLRLQRRFGNAATTALLAGKISLPAGALVVQRQPKSPSNPVEVAGRALRDFEAWADDEKKRQNVVDKAAVVGLDPKQATSVQSAAAAVAGYIPTMRAAAARADPAVASLRTAVAHATKANALMKSRDEADHRLAGPERTKSRDALVQAIGQVAKIGPGIDAAGLTKDLRAVETHLVNDGSLPEVIKYLNRSIDALGKVRTEADARAVAAQRVDVLLRAFLTVNNPAFKAAPTDAEMAAVRPQLAGGLGEEFAAVFGSSVDYDFFVEFANSWGQQIDARSQMSKAVGRPAPVIPGRTDAQTFFDALKGKGNGEVFAAYESFASAFFVHRGIASVADLTRTVADLFSSKATITGRRGLVCTGFATMGAEALARAGATLDAFKVGIHASDDMVRNDELEEQGHAIAQMTRRGSQFCVSNQHILPVKDALEGKDAISWGNASNRLFVGRGTTMAAAVAQLLEKVAARKRALPKK